jgi:hypothetical protein
MFSVILYMLRQTLRHRASPLPFPFSPSYCDVSEARSYFASTIHWKILREEASWCRLLTFSRVVRNLFQNKNVLRLYLQDYNESRRVVNIPSCREFPGSNLGPETGYPDGGLWLFSSVPPGKCWDSTYKLGHDRFLPIFSNSSFSYQPFRRRFII